MATWKKILTSLGVYPGDLSTTGAGGDKFLKTSSDGAGLEWGDTPTQVSAADDLSDIDTATNGSAKNDILMFDGTNYVPVVEGTTFLFDVTGFSGTGLSSSTSQSDILIGADSTAVYAAADTVTFTVTHKNGPATSGYIEDDSATAGWTDNKLVFSGSDFSSGETSTKTNTQAISYPTALGTSSSYGARLEFQATSFSDGTTVETFSSKLYKDFSNKVYWGIASANTGFDEAAIEAGAQSSITNDIGNYGTTSTAVWTTVNVTATNYFWFAVPTRLVTVTNTLLLKDDSSGLALDLASTEAFTITNSAGFAEEYTVYPSSNHSLGSFTLRTSR